MGGTTSCTSHGWRKELAEAESMSPNYKKRAVDAGITDEGPFSSTPAVVNGVVYVGSEDRRIYAFDAITGQLKWMNAAEAPI